MKILMVISFIFVFPFYSYGEIDIESAIVDSMGDVEQFFGTGFGPAPDSTSYIQCRLGSRGAVYQSLRYRDGVKRRYE